MTRRGWCLVLAAAMGLGLVSLVSNLTTVSQLSSEADILLVARSTISKLVNAPVVWAGLAVLSGWLVRRRVRAVAAGIVACLVALLAHYGLGTIVGVFDAGVWVENSYWFAAAVVIGGPLGLVGAVARRPDGWGLATRLLVPVAAVVEPFQLGMFTSPEVLPWPTRVSSVISGTVLVAAGISGGTAVLVPARRQQLARTRRATSEVSSSVAARLGDVPTELLYLHDAFLREVDATVVDVDRDGRRVALDRTVFYATGGGQPHDTGTLAGAPVVDVRKDGELVWHTIGGDGTLPATGEVVHGEVDWERRHRLMRTHTALHVLCGVIWNEWGTAVTGGNMEPLTARMDFEFDPLPEGFGQRVEELVNAELAAARPIEVTFLPRGEAIGDTDLIRTKVNLIPASVEEIRVVDIVGLDKQADGGTHVASTDEVGRIRVVKTESKGKGNKRIRIEVLDA